MRVTGRATRAAVGVAVLLGLMAAEPPAVLAETRTMASLRASAPFLDSGTGGFGVDLEREGATASSWLVGLSLDPVGLYGGLRRYTRRSGDRPFYSGYLSLTRQRDGRYWPGAWLAGGYEVRFDPQVRATGELGFGLVSGPWDELRSQLFIALSLGIRL